MILKQYYLNCLAHASYLIADEATKIAAVVDPQRDIQQISTMPPPVAIQSATCS